jgi:hypothetical protein
MKRGVLLLRVTLALVLGWCLVVQAQARAAPAVEYLAVPSAAMGRDTPPSRFCPAARTLRICSTPSAEASFATSTKHR